MAYTLTNLRNDLRIKERSISDLIRYIKTGTDDNPNYSLLMGAGCSVTSGIKSANELITNWKQEIYDNRNGVDIESFFKQACWYDERNPYSSLFEKKYDLPRQRRMFVEQEVRDKLPSIGYAYLMKLIENNYFKTIFTTNFDDLLNESFYLYSDRRPIVCAHDSAINSITITSKRPKIIKLHGDYLFDDIKSTLRETESLEENIKNKFIEFAKDYGLIVLGYGGNDRSIVDILTYLLKNEDYFKNGIYWCLRKDCEISDELRKLLWKDRVYYVQIDGFDELMAELNSTLNNGILPISNDILNNDNKIRLIEHLTKNELLKNSDSELIKLDCKKLSQSIERNIVGDFFKYINKDKDDKYEGEGFIFKQKNSFENSEKEIIRKIQQLILVGDKSDALATINNALVDNNISKPFKLNLLRLKIDVLKNNENNEKLSIYQQLITEDPYSIKYYIRASRISQDYEDKLDYIDNALNKNSNSAILFLEKSKIMFLHYTSTIAQDDLKYNLDDIIALLNKSIEINPHIQNDAWILKLDVFKEKNKADKKLLTQEYEEIINIYEKQSTFYPSLVNVITQHNDLTDKDRNVKYSYIKNAIQKSIDNDISEYIKYNEFNLLDAYTHDKEFELVKKRFEYIEKSYEVDNTYWEYKASALFQHWGQLKEAVQLLEDIKIKNQRTYEQLFEYYLYYDMFEKAKTILEQQLNNDILKRINFYTEKKEYQTALDLMEQLQSDDDLHNIDNVVSKSFLLLKTKQYDNACSFIKENLKYSNYTNGPLLINYYIALIKKEPKSNIQDKIRSKFLQEPLKATRNKLELAAAYALLEEKQNMYDNLRNAIAENKMKKYIIRDWIVFEKYIDDEKFKKLLE